MDPGPGAPAAGGGAPAAGGGGGGGGGGGVPGALTGTAESPAAMDRAAMICDVAFNDNLAELKKFPVAEVLATRDHRQWSPLLHACASRGVQVAKYLVKLKADVNAASEKGQTCMHFAAVNQSLDVLRLLLGAKASVNACDCKGHTPLFVAAEKGNVPVARALLREGSADVDARSHRGWTSFLIAVRKSQHAMAAFLLKEAGADVNVTTHNKHTAAHIAAQHGPPSLLTGVLRHARALDLVLRYNQQQRLGVKFDWVLRKICHMASPPPSTIVNRATTRVITIVTGFGAGQTRTATAHNGTVPLHIAAHKGPFNCVLALLKAKASPLQADSMGRTAYAHALRAGRQNVARLLRGWSSPHCCPLGNDGGRGGGSSAVAAATAPVPATAPATAGADTGGVPGTGSRTGGGGCCLSLCAAAAAGPRHARCAQFLLRAKAAVDMYDFSVRPGTRPYATPLTVAAGSGNAAVARVLLCGGAHAEGIRGCETMLLFRDANGRLILPEALSRPLLLAAAHGYSDVVELLCEAKADVQSKSPLRTTPGDRYSATPLVAAARAGCVDVVRLLLAAHADPAREDSRHETALAVAKQGMAEAALVQRQRQLQQQRPQGRRRRQQQGPQAPERLLGPQPQPQLTVHRSAASAVPAAAFAEAAAAAAAPAAATGDGQPHARVGAAAAVGTPARLPRAAEGAAAFASGSPASVLEFHAPGGVATPPATAASGGGGGGGGGCPCPVAAAAAEEKKRFQEIVRLLCSQPRRLRSTPQRAKRKAARGAAAGAGAAVPADKRR